MDASSTPTKNKSPIRLTKIKETPLHENSLTLCLNLQNKIEEEYVYVFEKNPFIRNKIIALLDQMSTDGLLCKDNYDLAYQKMEREIKFQMNKLRNRSRITLLDSIYQQSSKSPSKQQHNFVRLPDIKIQTPSKRQLRAISGQNGSQRDISGQNGSYRAVTPNNSRPLSSLQKKKSTIPFPLNEQENQMNQQFLDKIENEEANENQIGQQFLSKDESKYDMNLSFLKMITEPVKALINEEYEGENNQFEVKKLLYIEELQSKEREREKIDISKNANNVVKAQWGEMIERKKREYDHQRRMGEELRKNIDQVVQIELRKERQNSQLKKQIAMEDRFKVMEFIKEQKARIEHAKQKELEIERKQIDMSIGKVMNDEQHRRQEILQKAQKQNDIITQHEHLASKMREQAELQRKQQEIKILQDRIILQKAKGARYNSEYSSRLYRAAGCQQISPVKLQ